MRRREWMALGLGGAAAAASIFAVGGAFRWGQALVAALVAAALASQLLSKRRLASASPLIVALALAAGMTAISLVPLPQAIREHLDPVGTALRADGATLLDLAPWPGITRDAPGSLRALVFFLTLLGIATLTLRMSTSERGRYRVIGTIAALCGLTALVTAIHEVFGATELYGLYAPHATPSILGPLLNENHLGSLMALGTCAAIGLVMYPRQRGVVRAAWMVVVVACGAATAASHSRGALLALIAGAIVTAGVLLGQRLTAGATGGGPRSRSRFGSSLPIVIVGACVVVLVVYSSAGRVSAELGKTTLDELSNPRSKFAAWRSAKDLVEESPWVGVGRGGFEPSFTRVYAASGTVTFAYLENEYLQAVVDWGVVGGLLIALATMWLAATAIRRWRDGPLAAGALGAVAAIAIQSNVDFGIELLGLAVPITALAATLAYVPVREDSGRPLVIARALRALHVAGLLAGAALLLSSSTTSLEEDHERISTHPTAADVHDAVQRHPLDYFGYAMASELATTGRIQLLNHAMRLHPTHPYLHRRAAELLLRAGHPDQAALEYADALRATPTPAAMLADVVATFSPKLAATAIPLDVHNLDLVVTPLRELHREDVATLWLARVLEQHPTDVHACNLLYDLSLERGDLDAAEVAGRSCVELLPDHQTRMSLAGVLLQRHGYAEVVRLLGDVDSWTGLIDDKVNAWLMLCDAHIGLEHWDDAQACLHHLEASGNVAVGKSSEIVKRLERIQQQR